MTEQERSIRIDQEEKTKAAILAAVAAILAAVKGEMDKNYLDVLKEKLVFNVICIQTVDII